MKRILIKITLILHIGICFCLLSKAQSKNFSLKPAAIFDGVTYMNVTLSSNSNYVWITGSLGSLLVSHDKGKSWKDISPFINKNDDTNGLSKVTFRPDHLTGWVIGTLGSLYRTTNGGITWKKVFIKSSNNLIDIHYTTDYKMIRVLSSNNYVFESTDEGKSWKKLHCDYPANGIVPYKNSFLTYTDGGGIYLFDRAQKRDRDTSETFSPKIKNGDITDLKYSSYSKKYLGVADSFLFCASPNLDWKIRSTVRGLKNPYELAADRSMKQIYIIGDFSKLYRSNDGGLTWKLEFDLVTDGFDFYSINCSEDGKYIWICGTNKTIISSEDFGKSWKFKLGTYFNKSFHKLKNINNTLNGGVNKTFFRNSDKLLYSIGERGAISSTNLQTLKSQKLASVSLDGDLKGMYYDSVNDNIYASGYDQCIIRYCVQTKKTEILHRNNDLNIMLNAISFNSDLSIGISVGEESTALITFNRGKTWQNISYFENTYTTLTDVIIKNDNIYIIGRRGNLYHSNNRGKNWSLIQVADSTNSLTSIDYFKNGKIGFITSTGGVNSKHLFKTVDGGLHWSEVSNFPNTRFRDLRTVKINPKNNDVFVMSTEGEIFRSSDYGYTWFKISPYFTYKAINYVSFDNDNNPVFSGYDGTLLLSVHKDFLPVIKKFRVYEMFGRYRLDLETTDKESQKNLQYNLSVLNPLTDEYNQIYTSQYFDIEHTKFQSIPAPVFKEGKRYLFKLTVFDGWNIVTKTISVQIGRTLSEKLIAFMHWNDPLSYKAILVNLSAFSILYALSIVLLYYISPISFIKWHENVANSNLPFPEKLSKFLVLYMVQSNKSLDAFVKMHKKKALQQLYNSEEVKSRTHWAESPFRLDGHDIISFQQECDNTFYVGGLREIQTHISTDRVIIRIEGQGGIGKTSLALQIARWGIESNVKKRLHKFLCLPIYIDNLGGQSIDDAIISKMELLIDATKMSNTLSAALLRKKRIIAIVDGISEMSCVEESHYDPEKGAKNIHFVIYTSRKPLNIIESIQIVPLGLKIDYLDMLIDGFTNSYVGAFKFGEQREVIRYRVKEMINDLNGQDITKPVSLSILKEIIIQASKLQDQDIRLSDGLAQTVDELFDTYLSDLFRKQKQIDSIIFNLRKAALISVGLEAVIKTNDALVIQKEVKPQWMSELIYKTHFTDDLLNIFIDSGCLYKIGDIGDRQIKFKHDPVGEYLAAKELLILFREGLLSYDHLELIMRRVSSVTFRSLLLSSANKMNIDLPDLEN